MFSQIGNLIIQTFCNLFLVAVLLRFMLQVARADFYNPISQFLVRVTNPLLKPLRKIIPGLMGVDVAALVLALLVELLTITLVLLVFGRVPSGMIALLSWSVLGVLAMVVNIYYLAIIGSIILSWVAMGSYNPAIVLINQLVEPVMAPFRRLLPPISGLDLSPILVFLAVKIVRTLLQYLGDALPMLSTLNPAVLIPGL